MSSPRYSTAPPCGNVEEIAPQLANLAKTTVRLHPRRRSRDLPFAKSKIGGRFLWAKNSEWPYCNEHEQAFIPVIQLRKQDVPELGFPEGMDTFQMMWCPFSHNYMPRPMIFWHDSNSMSELQPRAIKFESNDAVARSLIPLVCAIHPERLIEYPLFRYGSIPGYAFGFPPELHDAFQKAQLSSVPDIRKRFSKVLEYDDCITENEFPAYVYSEELSVAPGTKVGGYVNSVDPMRAVCDCGNEMGHLLTIASFEFEKQESRWCPIQDQKRTEVMDAKNPTGMTIGDGMDFVLFICRNCEGWPTKHFQTI